MVKTFSGLNSWGTAFAMLLLAAASTITGCQKREASGVAGSTSADSESGKASSSEYSVPASASPREVAELALKAIEAGELQGLQNLLATKKIKADIQAITRGKNAFSSVVDKAVPLAASAITREIEWLEPEGRTIDQEEITGETAKVVVKGTRMGKPLTRQFFLIREDGIWKLVPSHR